MWLFQIPYYQLLTGPVVVITLEGILLEVQFPSRPFILFSVLLKEESGFGPSKSLVYSFDCPPYLQWNKVVFRIFSISAVLQPTFLLQQTTSQGDCGDRRSSVE